MALVDAFEQVVESQGDPHEKDLGDELGGDAGAKERLGGGDVVGRGRGVSVDDQLAGNVQEGEGARYGDEYVQQAYESAGVPGGAHVSSRGRA